MSVLNQSGEEQVECPLCMEPLEVDDLHFYPCTCGYQICRFCWNRIREGENGLCPACRKAYPENPADFTPLSQEEVAAIKTEKKAREQKRRNKTLESRRALANVRVVQNNLVFVVGLPVRLADPEILKRQEYFGKYGKIHKVVINQSTAYAGSQGPSASAYVTYLSSNDALRAIQGVNNVTLDGRVLKGSLGTTKYCANFMKNQPCPKPDCMYLHDLGDPKASFTKEEMHAGLHQVYERKLHMQLLQKDNKTDDKNGTGTTNNIDKDSKEGIQMNNVSTAAVSSQINVVHSNRSKKDSSNGSSSSSSSDGSSREAWPSLSSTPPNDTDSPQSTSPKLDYIEKSTEPNTPEPIIPTEQPQPQQQKTKEDKHKKEKKKQTDTHKKHKADSITDDIANTTNNIVSELAFEESLNQSEENADLIEDDTHDLLNDNEILRQRELLAGLVETNVPKMNGYMHEQYIDRMNLNQGLLEKDILLRDRSRSDVMLRQNEMLARRSAVLEPKHFMQNSSIGMDSPNDLIGANYHTNHNILPFGLRVDNSLNTINMNTSLNINSNPLNMTSNPLNMNSNPLNMNSNPHNINSNPLNMNSNPLNMNSNPLNINSNPLNMTSNLLNINSGNSLNIARENMNMGNSTMNINRDSINLGRDMNMANSSMNMIRDSMSIGRDSMSMGRDSINMGRDMNIAREHMNMNRDSINMGRDSMSMAKDSMSMGRDSMNMGSSGINMNSPLGNNMSPYLLQQQMQQMNQQQQQMQQHNGLLNGFDGPHNSEGRYVSENMDKFFLDFHKAQQRRLQQRGMPPPQRNHDIKQRMGVRAAGDADDDLDFDPFKETQKALAEMMESEMAHAHVQGDSLDRVRVRSRAPPPGFAPHALSQNHQVPRLSMQQHQGYSPNSAMFTDWTQMDPAIMSTSVHPQQKPMNPQPMNPINQPINQQHDLFARFNQLQVNGVNNSAKLPANGLWGGSSSHKMWAGGRVPLPPGFAPNAECIDAK